MSDPLAKSCDEVRLNLYLDGELGTHETEWMDAHLKDCSACRQQATTVVAFTRAFRQRIKEVAGAIDFVALEKQVIKKTIPRHVPRNGLASFLSVMRILVPALLVGGFLLFYIYTHFIAKPMPGASATIDAFSGTVSTVMVLQTPERRQTILWFKEGTNPESEHDGR